MPVSTAITLGPGHAWREAGRRVRSALLAALGRPGQWYVDSRAEATGPGAVVAPRAAADARLYDVVLAAVAGDVGDLARSHGGAIELVSVSEGVVIVRMRGACHGCPAAALTLHARLERALRAACPDLREVRKRGSPPEAPANRGNGRRLTRRPGPERVSRLSVSARVLT